MVSTKKLSIVCYCVTFVIFLVIFLWGKFGLTPGEEMGFSVLNFYIVMPVVSFGTALLLGIKDAELKLAYPVFAGVLGFVVPPLVFNSVSFIALLFAFVPALTGLGIGMLIYKRKKN